MKEFLTAVALVTFLVFFTWVLAIRDVVCNLEDQALIKADQLDVRVMHCPAESLVKKEKVQ